MSISEPAAGTRWPEPVGIIGGGAVGIALNNALYTTGISLVGIGSRDPARLAQIIDATFVTTPEVIVTTARLVFLTVPDSAILAVAAGHSWRADQWVVHCAGSQPADYLADVVAPAQAGAFHPLGSFARYGNGAGFARSPATPRQLPFADHMVAVDGPDAVVAGLGALTQHLGARPLVVPAAARAGYHLAASLASNALVALISDAVAVWEAAGLDAQMALPALIPLIASTQSNLAQVGLPDALTGPIARGDITTVTRHLAVFADTPTLAPVAIVYRALGLQAVTLARAQGRADAAALDEIARLLSAPDGE